MIPARFPRIACSRCGEQHLDTEALADERYFAESDRYFAGVLDIGKSNPADLHMVGVHGKAVRLSDVKTVRAVHLEKTITRECRIAGADHRIIAQDSRTAGHKNLRLEMIRA
jgi:hypothetical protein